MILWIGAGALIAAALIVRNPTPRIWHQRIIAFRAGLLMAEEMWDGAMARRSRWAECLERAKHDV